MTEVKKPERRTGIKRLTSTQKAEAIALWKSGSVTLDDLAKKFKKDRGTFARLFREEGITKGETRAETERKVKEAVETALIDDAAELARRIKDTKEEHYKFAKGISTLAWSMVVKAQKEGTPYAVLLNDMKTLEMATRVFKMSREEKYSVLGIREDDDNEDKPLPDLVVQELTAQDIKELHERSLMADDELGLNEEDLGDDDLIGESSDMGDEEGERIEVDD